MTADETKLYQQLRAGSETALAQVIGHFGPVVYALTKKVLGPAAEADVEECVSETFWRVWQRIDQYDPNRSTLRTFILMHAKYAALDGRRYSRRSRDKDPCFLPQAAPPMVDTEERQRVQHALDSLSTLDKKIIYLRYYLDQSIKVIAKEMELSESAVETRLWRSRQKLRVLLDESEERGLVT